MSKLTSCATTTYHNSIVFCSVGGGVYFGEKRLFKFNSFQDMILHGSIIGLCTLLVKLCSPFVVLSHAWVTFRKAGHSNSYRERMAVRVCEKNRSSALWRINQRCSNVVVYELNTTDFISRIKRYYINKAVL